MKEGDLVGFNNPVDQVVYQDRVGLLISFYEDKEVYHCWMAYVLLCGETELYDFPTSCLEVLSAAR